MPSPSQRVPGEPEVPADIPPEYADAYLAGFRRGIGGIDPDTITDAITGQADPTPAPAPPATDDEPAQPEEVAEPEVPGAPADDDAVDREPEPEDRTERGSTDLEWLFDRRESGPPGWSGGTRGSATDSTDTLRPDADPATSAGATSVAGRGPKSPWPLLGAFVVVLLLLMLLAYLGGMAFSTIMNR